MFSQRSIPDNLVYPPPIGHGQPDEMLEQLVETSRVPCSIQRYDGGYKSKFDLFNIFIIHLQILHFPPCNKSQALPCDAKKLI